MAPPRWTSDPQLQWLTARIGKYLQSQSEGDQIEFFANLDEAWFALYPAEIDARVPSRDSGQELTPEQTKSVSEALEKRKSVSGVFYLALAPCFLGFLDVSWRAWTSREKIPCPYAQKDASRRLPFQNKSWLMVLCSNCAPGSVTTRRRAKP
jgi:hypothetical protein